ncbi:MAG TPA: MOSC domain-containing protein [Gaiellaceae bacterium]|nr:MOSC domain-containing protein [Gaiellaceae bacterium]
MNVVSVNAGRAEPMKIGARTITTGIRKVPVGRGYVGMLGLEGDVVANEKHHGGPDQALYLYSSEDYAWWGGELGGAPRPGTFGENLTLSSFGSGEVRIGDRFRVGPTLLEVTSPRIPCATFATRMGEPNWVKRFAEARRPGLYVRVLEQGEVAAGDPVERLGGGDAHPTVVTLMDAWYDPEPDAALLERVLAAPVAVRDRAGFEKKLARLSF